jgi:hypothetical protein
MQFDFKAFLKAASADFLRFIYRVPMEALGTVGAKKCKNVLKLHFSAPTAPFVPTGKPITTCKMALEEDLHG